MSDTRKELNSLLNYVNDLRKGYDRKIEKAIDATNTPIDGRTLAVDVKRVALYSAFSAELENISDSLRITLKEMENPGKEG